MISFIIATVLFAPAYVLKLRIFDLPANFLMLWIFLFWLIFFIFLVLNKSLIQFLTPIRNWGKTTLIFITLFFLSGIIGFFYNGASLEKLGQFIVLFLQPVSLFFIAGYIFKKFPDSKHYLLNAVYFSLALAGLLAFLQYFSLWGLPKTFWGNSVEPKRAISFFIHPNFYALWCAPLLAFLLPDLGLRVKNFKKDWVKILLWTIGGAGLILSLSRSGWLGLGIAILVYLIIAADKKIRKLAGIIMVVLVIVIISIPNLRWRFALPLYGEKSAVSRLSLWNTGLKGIKESPLFGLGLTGFSQNWERLNTDPGLTEPHNFPHNIFLNFWVETGILGLFSFIGLLWLFIYQGLKSRQNIFKLGVSLFLITMVFQGLIDNPYFKNDLSIIFWIIMSLI